MPAKDSTGFHRAFTLIELLVVITIITILTSMLMPALENARYQAKLAVCGARLRQVGLGLSTYTIEYDGWYPYRRIMGFTLIKYDNVNIDDRPVLRPYLPLNFMTCPLSPLSGVDLDKTDERAVYLGYELIVGAELVQNDMTTRLWKTSDVPEYNGMKFDIMASDCEKFYHDSRGYLYLSSHPDRGERRLRLKVWRSDYSMSRWVPGGGYPNWLPSPAVIRGKLDRNFLHTDVSVSRLTNLDFPNDPRTPQIRNRSRYTYFLPPK